MTLLSNCSPSSPWLHSPPPPPPPQPNPTNSPRRQNPDPETPDRTWIWAGEEEIALIRRKLMEISTDESRVVMGGFVENERVCSGAGKGASSSLATM